MKNYRFKTFLNEVFFLILTWDHFFSLLSERGERRERNVNTREDHWLVASNMCLDWGLYTLDQGLYMPRSWIKPSTLACSLTRNRTHNPLVMGWHSNQLSHTGQGLNKVFYSTTSLQIIKTYVIYGKFSQ